MSLFLFDILVVMIIKLDIEMYKRQITPLSILIFAYTILINLNNLFIAKKYGLHIIEDYVVWTFFPFFVCLLGIDLFFGNLYRRSSKVSTNYSIRFKSYLGVTFFFLIGVAAYSIQLIKLLSIYGLDLKGRNNGLLGHLSFLAFILGPVSLDLAIKERDKFKIAVSILANIIVLLISVLFGGKYVIFINTTYFLLYFNLKRDKQMDIKKILKILIPLGISAILIFIFIYYVIPNVTGQYQSSFGFAIEHMFEYLLGPVIANNYTIIHAGEGETLVPFGFFINLWKAYFREGDYIKVIYEFLFPISNIKNTNVSGFLGEIIYDLGIIGSMLYASGVYIITNIFYFLYRTKNKYYLCLCYSTSILVFSFFCNFISVSGVMLPFTLAFVMDTFSLFKIGNRHI